jgi:hypothetical protein
VSGNEHIIDDSVVGGWVDGVAARAITLGLTLRS